MTPDVNAMARTLIGHIYAATLTTYAGGPVFVDTTVNSTAIKAIRQTTPPDPYPQGWPKPFGILRVPGHSTALADESQTTSNIPGTPNTYLLGIYMAAYQKEADRETEELLLNDIYSAIATYLRPPSDEVSCLPDSNAIVVAVKLQPPTIAGPFLVFGSQIWIGTAISIQLDEWYQ